MAKTLWSMSAGRGSVWTIAESVSVAAWIVSARSRTDLAAYGSLIDHHTMHDALLIANHRVRGTEAIVTKDSAFVGEPTVWG
jgi:hypothetical protein